jgi:hypothetical protein
MVPREYSSLATELLTEATLQYNFLAAIEKLHASTTVIKTVQSRIILLLTFILSP